MALSVMTALPLGVTALAADEKNGVTITDEFTDSIAKFVEDNDGKIQVTVTSAQLAPKYQYMVAVFKGAELPSPITESTVLYCT